ncbi:hypothetical protein BDR26DRAFT_1005538 [Obelidium mucronatum]|nr:hypothetical protein BDR26DRAFT_1005538 [Obelidium mucronatum]
MAPQPPQPLHLSPADEADYDIVEESVSPVVKGPLNKDFDFEFVHPIEWSKEEIQADAKDKSILVVEDIEDEDVLNSPLVPVTLPLPLPPATATATAPAIVPTISEQPKSKSNPDCLAVRTEAVEKSGEMTLLVASLLLSLSAIAASASLTAKAALLKFSTLSVLARASLFVFVASTTILSALYLVLPNTSQVSTHAPSVGIVPTEFAPESTICASKPPPPPPTFVPTVTSKPTLVYKKVKKQNLLYGSTTCPAEKSPSELALVEKQQQNNRQRSTTNHGVNSIAKIHSLAQLKAILNQYCLASTSQFDVVPLSSTSSSFTCPRITVKPAKNSASKALVAVPLYKTCLSRFIDTLKALSIPANYPRSLSQFRAIITGTCPAYNLSLMVPTGKDETSMSVFSTAGTCPRVTVKSTKSLIKLPLCKTTSLTRIAKTLKSLTVPARYTRALAKVCPTGTNQTILSVPKPSPAVINHTPTCPRTPPLQKPTSLSEIIHCNRDSFLVPDPTILHTFVETSYKALSMSQYSNFDVSEFLSSLHASLIQSTGFGTCPVPKELFSSTATTTTTTTTTIKKTLKKSVKKTQKFLKSTGKKVRKLHTEFLNSATGKQAQEIWVESVKKQGETAQFLKNTGDKVLKGLKKELKLVYKEAKKIKKSMKVEKKKGSKVY